MDCRSPALVCLVIVTLFVIAAGCTTSQSPTAPTVVTVTGGVTVAETTGHAVTTGPARESGAEQLATVRSTNPVFLEAYRMFRNTRSTEYVHPPYTDNDAAGIYKFDCLGFVDHVLMNATPVAYREIGNGANPSIESYAAAFSRLDTKSPRTLLGTRVEHPRDLQPGDVCLWLKPNTLDTGHIWIIAGEPAVNPKQTDEVMVRIFDSTGTVHTDDSRTGAVDKTGLGSGILGFMVDEAGNPVGLYWEGGVSTGAGEKDTTIACGRLTR